MSSRTLKRKPLVEAIFEVRWALGQKAPGITADPHYRLLLARIYDRLQSTYPEHEQLETANIPDEMVGHVVQHRFRSGKGEWPLLQLGPGILTVNDTDKYEWQGYRDRVTQALATLYSAHPKLDELAIESMTLRYVDAVEYDHGSSNVLDFLEDKLKVGIKVPEDLFENANISSLPQGFHMHLAYRVQEPRGEVTLRFGMGRRESKPAVIWETICHSAHGDLPALPEQFNQWLEQAHSLLDDWFFKMIEGDLLRSFNND